MSTACAWWVAMSRANPASTESSRGVPARDAISSAAPAQSATASNAAAPNNAGRRASVNRPGRRATSGRGGAMTTYTTRVGTASETQCRRRSRTGRTVRTFDGEATLRGETTKKSRSTRGRRAGRTPQVRDPARDRSRPHRDRGSSFLLPVHSTPTASGRPDGGPPRWPARRRSDRLQREPTHRPATQCRLAELRYLRRAHSQRARGALDGTRRHLDYLSPGPGLRARPDTEDC